MSSRRFLTHNTPFPNRLLDEVMPTLTDTEWRILCVVVRATLGWEGEGGERKQTDWLTQRQLKARTGRANEAISHALDGLVKKGLLRVQSEAGDLLDTPEKRQRYAGKHLFCLGPKSFISQEEPQQDCSLSEQPYSESGFRKSNTTKETVYKKTPYGVERQRIEIVEKAVEKPAEPRRARTATETANQPDTDVKRFLAAYQAMFARRSEQGEMPPIAWGRDSKVVKELLAQYGYERLVELLALFFQSEDAWVKKRGYALSCFPTVLPSLLMGGSKGNSAASRRCKQTTLVVPNAGSGGQWSQASEIAVSSASLFERYPDLAKRISRQPP